MPTIQEGESFRNFKRRLNKVKMEVFANTTADAIARQNEQTHMNPKRKQYISLTSEPLTSNIFHAVYLTIYTDD